jgi:hypothetical protein
MLNIYAIIAGIAIAVLALAEVLISIQKWQMKKQFLDELNQRERKNSEKESSPS